MLVSCVMLTKDRRDLLPLALRSYRSQDWTEKELIVIDDGKDHVEDLFQGIPECRYFHTEPWGTVSDKLAFACDKTSGEILVTWDDDDWYAPTRITDQVTRLVESGKSLTGYHTILFFDGQRVWQYRGERDYCTGTSQVYRRSLIKKHRPYSKNVGYDNDLWGSARNDGGVIAVDGTKMLVARIHDRNVSGPRRSLGGSSWPEVPIDTLPKQYLDDIRQTT